MARAGRKDRGLYENPKGSGVWWVEVYFQGKRKRYKLGNKTKARNFYDTKKLEQREERFDPSAHDRRKRKTFLADVIQEYVDITSKAPAGNKKRYGRWWKKVMKDKQLKEITTASLEKLQTRLLNKGKKAPATINHYFKFLRYIFNLAIRDGIAISNPVSKLKMPKVPNGRLRFLTEEEEKTLKGRMIPEDFALVEFAINTGLRRTEQFTLKWSHIDQENRVLTIPRSKSGETRHVQLNDKVMEILKRLNSWMISPWVFPGINASKPREPQNFYNRIFIPALEGDETKNETKIEGVVWHTLRHTFASRLVMAGVNLRTVQELMGHKTIEMTLRYSHLSKGHLNEAVQTLVKKPGVQTVENPEIPVPTAT